MDGAFDVLDSRFGFQLIKMVTMTNGRMETMAEEILGMIRKEGIVDLPAGFGVSDDLFLAGMDSMAVMQLLVSMEERYGVSFGAEDVTRERFGSAVALADLLGRKLTAGDGVQPERGAG